MFFGDIGLRNKRGCLKLQKSCQKIENRVNTVHEGRAGGRGRLLTRRQGIFRGPSERTSQSSASAHDPLATAPPRANLQGGGQSTTFYIQFFKRRIGGQGRGVFVTTTDAFSHLHAVDAAANLHESCDCTRIRVQKKTSSPPSSSAPALRASSTSNRASWDSRLHRLTTAFIVSSSLAPAKNSDESDDDDDAVAVKEDGDDEVERETSAEDDTDTTAKTKKRTRLFGEDMVLFAAATPRRAWDCAARRVAEKTPALLWTFFSIISAFEHSDDIDLTSSIKLGRRQKGVYGIPFYTSLVRSMILEVPMPTQFRMDIMMRRRRKE